jgi:hypothetical protein
VDTLTVRLSSTLCRGESNVACSDVWSYRQGTNCAMSSDNCAGYYACQFPAMIADWRASFAAPWQGTGVNFTFLFVGLPAYVQDLPSTLYDGRVDGSLPLLRLAQAAATKLDNTYMTSLIDHGYMFGPWGSIHPMDKTPVGRRLFLAAREVSPRGSRTRSGHGRHDALSQPRSTRHCAPRALAPLVDTNPARGISWSQILPVASAGPNPDGGSTRTVSLFVPLARWRAWPV